MGQSRLRSFSVSPSSGFTRWVLPWHCSGHLLELLQRPVGEADFAWQSQYGNVVRIKSAFGVRPLSLLFRCGFMFNYAQEDRLLIADPKALQKILNTSADNYVKLPNLRVISRTLNGEGIIWADGNSRRVKVSFEITT